MASATVTLRPSYDALNASSTNINGAATAWQALSDNSDGSWVGGSWSWDAFGVDGYYVGFPVFNFVDAQIRSVAVRWRGVDNSASPRAVTLHNRVGATPNGNQTVDAPVSGTFPAGTGIPINATGAITVGSAPVGTQYNGAAWTQAALNTIVVSPAVIGDAGGGGFDGMTLTELYLDVVFNRPPRCLVTAPVGRSVNDGVTTQASTTVTSATAAFTSADAGKSIISTSTANQAYADGATTAGSQTVTSATANFTADDLGKTLSGGSIPAGSTITAINSSTSVVVSGVATATATGVTITINARQVIRTGTTIASVTNATTIVLSTAAAVTGTAINLGVGSPFTTTNKPSIGWVYLDPDGDAQERAWVRVFTQAQTVAVGFSPDTTTPFVDSGEMFTSATGFITSIPFAQNTNYVPYVKVADAGSSGRYSAWAAGPVFSIAPSAGLLFDPPQTPSMTATPDSVNNRVALAVSGFDNDLTRNQSSFESSIYGWEGETNCNVSRDTTQFLHGLASMKMSSAAAGDMGAHTLGTQFATGTPTLTGWQNALVKVTPGLTYTALASFRAAASGRSCRVDIKWYGPTGTYISTSTGATITDTTTGWTQAVNTVTAPVGAAFAGVAAWVLATGAASEVHWLDEADLGPGSSTVWTRGGFTQNQGGLVDTFTRADNASSLGSSEGPQTPAWTAAVGTWGIQSGRAYLASVTTDAVAYLVSPAIADGVMTCDITLSATTNRADADLIFRGADSNNFLMVQLIKTGTGTSDGVFLYKRVAGTYTSLGSFASAGLVNGATYGLKVEFFAGLIRVWLDRKDGKGYTKVLDVQLVPGDVAQFGGLSNNKFGFRSSNGAGADDGGSRFDNLIVANENNQVASVQRSYDGGVTWNYVRTARLLDLVDPGQTGAFYDYEVTRNQPVSYRVQVQATESDVTVVSAWSATVAMAPNLAGDGNAWLKSPTDPTKNVGLLLIKDSADSQSIEDQVIYAPLGRSDYLIHGGTVRMETFQGIEFLLRSDAEWSAFETLRKRQEPLLLQTCYGDTVLEEFWLRLGPARTVSRLSMSTSPTQLRRVKVPATQVLQPVVT